MQTWKPLVLSLVAGLGLVSAGCAKPPEEDLARAKEALQAARDAEAAIYAPDPLRDVALALQAAQVEIVTQEERFAILRNYDDAIEHLKTAMERAEATRQEALETKEAARVEAEARLENARAAVARAGSALEDAPRAKGTKADILALTSDLEGIKGQVAQLEGQIAAEEYFDAHDKADSIVVAADAIGQEIQAAIDMQTKLMDQRRQRQ